MKADGGGGRGVDGRACVEGGVRRFACDGSVNVHCVGALRCARVDFVPPRGVERKASVDGGVPRGIAISHVGDVVAARFFAGWRVIAAE
jgi:hypothetical protein